jgi:ribosome-binding ATPase YchF (GTP1/OBG family)
MTTSSRARVDPLADIETIETELIADLSRPSGAWTARAVRP